MTIIEYLESVKERLLTDPQVISFQIVRERSTATDGYLRARLELTNQQRLEFSEYVQRTTDPLFTCLPVSLFPSSATHSHSWAALSSAPHSPTRVLSTCLTIAPARL